MNSPLLAAHEPNDVPSLSGGGDDPDANSQLTLMLREASSPPSNATLIRSTARMTTTRHRSLTTVSFITILVGSLTLIQVALLWGSFLSPSWLQVHVVVTHIFFTPPLDTLVQTLDLGSMVTMFVSAGQTIAVGLLAITTVILPCCSMIAQPLTVMERHSAVILGLGFQAKSILNKFFRFGFLVVFLVLVLDICISFIELTLVDTQIAVQNRMGSGLLFYTIGMTMAVVVAKILTLSSVKEPTTATTPAEESYYMRVLEEEEEEHANIEETAEEPHHDELADLHSSGGACCSYRLIMFESAVLSVILGIAAWALPLFRVRYQGAAADFLPQTTLEVGLTDLLNVAQGPGHAIFQGTVLTQLFVFPSLAFLLATGVCCFGLKKQWLSGIHPAVNGITVCVAIIIIIPALQSLGGEMLDDQTSGLCSKFQDMTGESCLAMVGSIEAGTWCLMGHAVALETFILLTLWRA